MFLQGCKTFPRDETQSGEWRVGIKQQFALKLEQIEQIRCGLHGSAQIHMYNMHDVEISINVSGRKEKEFEKEEGDQSRIFGT